MRLIVLLAICLLSAPSAALAQTVTPQEASLDERDRKIAELTSRIERLERLLDARNIQPAVRQPTRRSPQTENNSQEIERALERALVQDETRLVAPGAIEIIPSLGYSYSASSDPLLVTDGSNSAVISDERRRSTIVAGLGARIGLPGNSQLSVSVPYRIAVAEDVLSFGDAPIDARSRNASSLGDVSFSLSHVLAGGRRAIPKVVGSLRGNLGTANRSVGPGLLGGGFPSLGAGVSVSQRLDPVVLAGSVSYDRVFAEAGIAPGDRWSYSLAAYLAVAPEVSFRTLFRQQFTSDTNFSGKPLKGSGQTAATLDFGVSVVPSRRALIDVGVAVGLTENAPDFALTLSTPLRIN